jgi:uncharacterized protein (DUF433 family)
MEIQLSNFTQIVADPAICQGLPRIKGTRITVSSLLAHLAGGMNIPQLIEAFPQLTGENITEALQFASQSLLETYIPLKAA